MIHSMNFCLLTMILGASALRIGTLSEESLDLREVPRFGGDSLQTFATRTPPLTKMDAVHVHPLDEMHSIQLQKSGVNSNDLRCSALWNRSYVIGSDGKHKCRKREMNPRALDGAPTPNMCIREYRDVVSDAFNEYGYWSDCLLLADLWKSLPDRSSEHQTADVTDSCAAGYQSKKLYMDIGANIGTCLLQMIARADVPHTLAFEPNPANLFYLTNSILATPGAPDKCSLFPDALGSSTEEHLIYSEPGNAGNTILDSPTHASQIPVGKVITHALDDVLMKNGPPPYIHLLKIDAQGYEVKIFQGASKLFSARAVNAVKFELATDWLIDQNTTQAEYINQFINYGFDIYMTDNLEKPLDHKSLQSFACNFKGVVDLVAVLKASRPDGPEFKLVCPGH